MRRRGHRADDTSAPDVVGDHCGRGRCVRGDIDGPVYPEALRRLRTSSVPSVRPRRRLGIGTAGWAPARPSARLADCYFFDSFATSHFATSIICGSPLAEVMRYLPFTIKL